MTVLTLVFALSVDIWVGADSCSQGINVALWLPGLTDPDFEIRGLGGGFVVFLSPKRQWGDWYWTCASSRANRSQLTPFLTFCYCNFLLEILSCALKESQASRLISALMQRMDNFFPLLITDYHPNTAKMKEERAMWPHLPEGHLCWIPLWGWHKRDNESPSEIIRKSNPSLSPATSPGGRGPRFIPSSWLWWAYETETFVIKGEWWVWQNKNRDGTSFLQEIPWLFSLTSEEGL